MSKNRGAHTVLNGQLLFVDIGVDCLTLDCLLVVREEDRAGQPVTLRVQLPDHPSEAQPAIELLEEWADACALVALTITEGRTGPAVEMSSHTGKVLLQPDI